MLTDQRIAALAPTVETIRERSYALDAAGLKSSATRALDASLGQVQ